MKTGIAAPRRCNCWVWAQYQYWRYGGYVMKRRSMFSPLINHYFWSEDTNIWYSFMALSSKPRGWWFEALWFKGEIVCGDIDAIAENKRLAAAHAEFLVARDLARALKRARAAL